MLTHCSAEDGTGKRQRNRPYLMSLSEMSTIVVLFHRMRARQFKAFYCDIVCRFKEAEFPRRLSYSRFVQLMHALRGRAGGIFSDGQRRLHGSVHC
ncbi:MAG: hypothetical protein NTZ64_15015 [Polaromonas sp.]|nr:hypothetical protein [Polaromonas sp.]